MTLPGLTEYTLPEAPEDFEPGRRCQMPLGECKTARQLVLSGQEPQLGKVNRYRRNMGSESKGPQGPLLCNLCAKAYLGDDLAKAIEKEVKRQGNQHVFFLPKLAKARLSYGEKRGEGQLSQQALAKMVGTNDTTISKIERGVQGATQTMSHNIARSLGVTVEELRGKA
jgi:DNA-binding XRE family transcriptional regulator